MTDAEVAALPRYKPAGILQRVIEKITGNPACDQCHRRRANCTVPIFDVGEFPGATPNGPTAKCKQYWCAECRAAVFGQGREYAWGDDRDRFLAS